MNCNLIRVLGRLGKRKLKIKIKEAGIRVIQEACTIPIAAHLPENEIQEESGS